MDAVRICQKLESETLHLPELRPFVGKQVEITIVEQSTAVTTPTASNWDAAMQAARELEDYDFDAYERQRECDLNHARSLLP